MDDRPTDSILRSWLALMRGPQLPASLLQELSAHARRGGALQEPDLPVTARRYLADPDWAGVDRDMQWLGQQGNHFLPLADPRYPELLRQIPDPPPGLFVRGDVDALQSMQLAVVGSRRPTADGRRNATWLGSRLVEAGFTLTSGLALGIDSIVHAAALTAGGRTIAVLANGLDRVYPRRNAGLAQQIAAQGALVSELPTGVTPLPSGFPRRNRLISGLSAGTLVIEAALKSGSLITAMHALAQGREVFAVPGAIRNQMVRGCHQLIQQGAKLVADVPDILDELGPLLAVTAAAVSTIDENRDGKRTLDERSKTLLDNIGYEPVNIDELLVVTGLSISELTSLLSGLEVAGHIEAVPGRLFVRK